MKVLMINGSRRETGCTYTALSIIGETLKEEGIDFEILNSGAKVFKGELDAALEEAAAAVRDADGFILGSPVYYASPSGEVINFMDRFMGIAGDDLLFMPATAVCSARRGGTSATLDVLNKYFMFNQMPVISSRYWNMVHGNTPEEVLKDEEGVQIMKTLGRNMVWIIRSIEAGKAAGVKQPVSEKKIFTNYIR